MQLNHYFSLASLVVLALFVSQINASAYLFVVHGVSNFDGNTNVNVNINGSRVISNFAYTSTAGYIAVPAGAANINITLVSNGAAIITETATLVDGVYYTVVAVGSLNDSTTYPFQLLIVQVDRAVSSDSKAKVAVFHAAAGAPSVDLFAGDSSLASGLSYPNGVVLSEVDAGTYNLSLRLSSNTSTVVLAIGDVALAGGKVNYFFALADFVGGETLSVKNLQPPSEDEPSAAATLSLPFFWLF